MNNEKKINELQAEINGLKIILRDNDYKTIKYAEGCISDSDFAIHKAKRAEYRAKINELEDELKRLLNENE